MASMEAHQIDNDERDVASECAEGEEGHQKAGIAAGGSFRAPAEQRHRRSGEASHKDRASKEERRRPLQRFWKGEELGALR